MSIRSENAQARPTAPPFDLFSDVMEQVRLEATVYFTVDLRAPCGVAIARAGRAPFYAVTEGRCEIQVGKRGAARAVEAGDFVLLPRGAPHVIRSARDAPVLPFERFVEAYPMDAHGHIRGPGKGPIVARVTGGFFSYDALKINPLFGALPPLIHLRGSDPAVARWLEPTLRFIHAEIDSALLGGRTVLRRMADVLFIQAVRAYIAQAAPRGGWMRGLADPRVARALALMHERFAEPWTLDALARAVGMSRTALAVRFKELVGEAPMSYLTQWRITRAANLLRAERTSLDRVAEAVGYNSQPVFSKAFRRVTGHTPARWRRGEGIAAGITGRSESG